MYYTQRKLQSTKEHWAILSLQRVLLYLMSVGRRATGWWRDLEMLKAPDDAGENRIKWVPERRNRTKRLDQDMNKIERYNESYLWGRWYV